MPPLTPKMPIATDAPSPSDWRREYDFHDAFVDCSGHRMHYVDHGIGAPLLCVHGNPTWSFYFRHLVRQFADQYRVLAVDHIGCGLSDKPQAYDYCLRTHTENLVRFVDQLDLQGATLVAHDWGGAIGLGAVVQRPDRFARIVLLNTGAFPPPFCPWRIRVCRWPLINSVGLRGLNAFARAAQYMTTARAPLSPTAKAGLIAPYQNWHDRIAIARFVQDIPLHPGHRTWQVLCDLEEDLRALAPRPTKLIWGMRDWCFTPECLQRMKDIFPHADVAEIEDAGHYVLEDATSEVCEHIAAFLES